MVHVFLVTAAVLLCYLPAFMISPWTPAREQPLSVNLGWLDTVRQTTPTSCGPALLAAMERIDGGASSTEFELLYRLPMGVHGLSLADFAQEARSIGWLGNWFEGTLQDLRSARTPIPVHFNEPANHFALVLNVAPDLFVVLDPAEGYLAIPPHQFADLWSRLFYL